MKRITIYLLSAAVLLIMAGCGGKRDQSLEKIMDSGELRLGLDENYPPMGFRDEGENLVGFDIDLAGEVCDRIGVKLTLVPIEWDKKEDELNSGHIDCIWNGMSITPERSENMLLSEPYLENDLVFAVRTYSDIQKISDLKGKTVGAQAGSSADDAIRESEIYNDINVVFQKDNLSLLRQLKAGELDAVLIDSVSIYYIAADNEDYVLISGTLGREDMAIGFRKNDKELRDKIQEKLSEMKSDGTLAEISEKWFGSDITTIR
ncbi:MAG: amino acid ABC transporter substrate-binding protein [Lachnospiraceae bacterium]|nr:amino acid ABC transporter substrate-binding protein [Lachnospiraceae bacterium]